MRTRSPQHKISWRRVTPLPLSPSRTVDFDGAYREGREGKGWKGYLSVTSGIRIFFTSAIGGMEKGVACGFKSHVPPGACNYRFRHLKHCRVERQYMGFRKCDAQRVIF